MNKVIKKESDFIRLLLNTTGRQQRALIKSITHEQMKAVVQIVYNVLQGNRVISSKFKTKLAKYKRFIRRFVSNELTSRRRIILFLKYYQFILPLLRAVEKELL